MIQDPNPMIEFISTIQAPSKVVVNSVCTEPPALDELLRGIRRDNLHGEWDTGPAVDSELW